MITINNLTKIFNAGKQNECVALDNISLTIKDGESVAIIGKSGSGKSTLLHIIAGIETATSGQIFLNKQQITSLSDNKLAEHRAQNIGIIMQDFCLVEACTALDNVMTPLNFVKMPMRKRKARARELIIGVGLETYVNKKVALLSGGEKQRIAIARALSADAPYILADEPTGALDTATTQDIMDMLLRINKRGKTLIIITHNLDIARQCNCIVELSDGKIIS